MSRFLKCTVSFFAVLSILLTSLLLSSPASAHSFQGKKALATCSSAATCDGVDPTLTVGPNGQKCSSDASRTGSSVSVITAGGLVLGTLELRYSPNCKSNWGRLTLFSACGNGCFKSVTTYRQGDNRTTDFNRTNFNETGSDTVIWSQMLYAPSPARAQACATAGSAPVSCTEWR